MTKATRISATLPADLTAFLDEYQQAHHLDSRSAALAEAQPAVLRRTPPITSTVWARREADSAQTHTGIVVSNNANNAQIEVMRATRANRLIKRLGYVPDDLMVEIDGKLRLHPML